MAGLGGGGNVKGRGDGVGGGSSWWCWRSWVLKENEKKVEEVSDYGDVGGWSSDDGDGVVMVRVKVVVVKRETQEVVVMMEL